ncbi:MAG: DNA primase [Deltaproteobacteria bacterium]|nr:DNA primase [Deltaproteobacteria bacterium]MBW2725217.1 DNA primase [Deltaproteobacteria bacterium]
MGRIPEETIQTIRDRIDIVAVIGRYVDLKKSGRNFKGRCPFHEEKTPSFNVNPDRQIFHCFGCQVGGNAMTFLMRYENLTFPEAVRTLGKECGVEVPDNDSGDRGVSERLFAANEHAQDFYQRGLESEEGKRAKVYLADRGLDDEAIETFGIGYAPNSWDELGKQLGRCDVTEAQAIAAGLLVERDSQGKAGARGSYARLRGRVVFPIRDVRDRIVGFGGRAIFPDQEPKYLNTPESPIFHKRDALYGFPQALEAIRKRGRVIVCEGYFDRIALARAELSESLATCGTALTEGHARQFVRRTAQVVLLFDGDAAGQSAVEKALHVLLPTGIRVRAALLPQGDDPDSFLNQHGPDALRKLIERAPDAIEIVIQNALKRGCSAPAEKAAVVSHVAPLVALFKDPVERAEYAKRLAMVTGTDPAAVEIVVRRVLGESRARDNRSNARSGGETKATPEPQLIGKRPAGREEQHLHLLTQIAYLHPTVLSDAVRKRVDELVPEGSWKSILVLLIDAAQDGRLDDSGAIDFELLEHQLDTEAAARLRCVVVDDLVEDSEASPEQMLEDVLGWFARRRRAAAESHVTRQLHDPNADVDDLLAKKQKQLEERRALQGVPDRTTQ